WLRAQVASGAARTTHAASDRRASSTAGRSADDRPADGAPTGPGEALALAAWRGQAHVGELLGDLGGRGTAPAVPAAELLAGLHRDLTAHLALVGAVPEAAVGRPRSADQRPREPGPDGLDGAPVGEELEVRLAALRAVLEARDAPALARVAVAHAEIVTLRPFLVGNGQLGRVVARLLAVRSGLEPTGVAVLDTHGAADPGRYRRALAGYASGTPAGVAAWLTFQADAVVAGCQAGAEVATAVLAGRVQPR
ncbi:Fic family protein, partial [Georgenia yuyongxinii]